MLEQPLLESSKDILQNPSIWETLWINLLATEYLVYLFVGSLEEAYDYLQSLVQLGSVVTRIETTISLFGLSRIAEFHLKARLQRGFDRGRMWDHIDASILCLDWWPCILEVSGNFLTIKTLNSWQWILPTSGAIPSRIMVVFLFSDVGETPNNGNGVPPKWFKNFTVSWSILPSVEISGGAIWSSTRRCTAIFGSSKTGRFGLNTDMSKALVPDAIISHCSRIPRIHSMLSNRSQVENLRLP